ncbi:MAG: APC family permease [Bifidobacteriaceae bacterium]|jgi:amino acid transporter|nr:APC family permease [Bifidobacteriaceae bacterium]
MPDVMGALGRLVLGRPTREFAPRAKPRPLRVRYALPLLAPDALSSVAYAPDEILLTLAAAGLAGVSLSPWVGLAIAAVMAVVIASYRQTVREYTEGGGDYTVAKQTLGLAAGGLVGGAAMVDSLLTVAVSVSCGAQYFGSIIPTIEARPKTVAVGLVAVIMVASLRGLKALDNLVILAVYAFIVALGVTAMVGGIEAVTGRLGPSPSEGLEPVPAAGFEQGMTVLAGAFLALRAFSSGAVALAGVQTIATGVQRFRDPKPLAATRSLAALGVVCGGLLLGTLWLARQIGVIFVADPARELRASGGGALPADFHQDPVWAQIAQTVFAAARPVYVVVIALVGLLLILAASSAFRWVPALMSMLAQDEFLPKQFYRRSDRRVAAHGIVTLGLGSSALIMVMGASVTRLIQLYIVGVFLSFTISQLGMLRHWNAGLPLAKTAADRRRMLVSRAVNALGLGLTAVALVIVVITKFSHGAWISLGLVAGAYWMMISIRRHYRRVAAELALHRGDRTDLGLPSRVHGIVLVSAMNRATARALAYARATRPSTLEALTVAVDMARVWELRRAWDRADVPVTLRILDSPRREITRPLIDHVTALRRRAPRDMVVLYIPEKVVRHWWERWLHNRSAARLTSRLRHLRGVVVATVPWQLDPTDGGTDE